MGGDLSNSSFNLGKLGGIVKPPPLIDPSINGQHYNVAVIGGGSGGLSFVYVSCYKVLLLKISRKLQGLAFLLLFLTMLNHLPSKHSNINIHICYSPLSPNFNVLNIFQ